MQGERKDLDKRGQMEEDLRIAMDYNEGFLKIDDIVRKYGYTERKSIYRRLDAFKNNVKAGEYDSLLGNPKPAWKYKNRIKSPVIIDLNAIADALPKEVPNV